ncbi:Adenylyltransferase and sulfurtransferase MOCS3, partial [Astathelohania contejeani]
NGVCYRCLFPKIRSNPPNCDEAGVVGSLCGVIGCMQATEAIKMILAPEKSAPTIITYNGFHGTFNKAFLRTCCKNDHEDNIKVTSTPKPRPIVVDPSKTISWEDFYKGEFQLIDVIYNLKSAI